ncbi:hypothetical protein [Salinibacterium sp. NK8237]|uniref:hypothetical protein n=1 Tax=Salinibacterium sp. NK8237 TaxID=2792038 RepID=UPI0018CEFB3C|nr:hypothetical protein [Salinibacterium sp. NK8237]MBH0129486.1 hypothetical protein [Salinibacterium sp. NK8237]
MNELLAASKDRHAHPPEPDPVEQPTTRAVRRVGPIDRLALHLGVALITWSRRPGRARGHARTAARAQHQLSRERLEQARAREEQNYPRFIIR